MRRRRENIPQAGSRPERGVFIDPNQRRMERRFWAESQQKRHVPADCCRTTRRGEYRRLRRMPLRGRGHVTQRENMRATAKQRRCDRGKRQISARLSACIFSSRRNDPKHVWNHWFCGPRAGGPYFAERTGPDGVPRLRLGRDRGAVRHAGPAGAQDQGPAPGLVGHGPRRCGSGGRAGHRTHPLGHPRRAQRRQRPSPRQRERQHCVGA